MGISLNDFSLPAELNALKKETKQEKSKYDPRFKNLFKAIKKAGTPDFKTLNVWIEYLLNNPYTVDIDNLKRL